MHICKDKKTNRRAAVYKTIFTGSVVAVCGIMLWGSGTMQKVGSEELHNGNVDQIQEYDDLQFDTENTLEQYLDTVIGTGTSGEEAENLAEEGTEALTEYCEITEVNETEIIPDVSEEQTEIQTVYFRTVGRYNLRTSADGEWIRTLDEGTVCTKTGNYSENGNWTEIILEDRSTGWIVESALAEQQ